MAAKPATREEYFTKAAGHEIVRRARVVGKDIRWSLEQVIHEPRFKKHWEVKVNTKKITSLSKKLMVLRKKIDKRHSEMLKAMQPLHNERRELEMEVRKLDQVNVSPAISKDFVIWYLDVMARDPKRIDTLEAMLNWSGFAEAYCLDVYLHGWTPGKVKVTVEVVKKDA